MKKIALSFFVLASSGAYVWDQAATAPTLDILDTADPSAAQKSVQEPAGMTLAPATAVAPHPLLAPTTDHQSVRIEAPETPPATLGNETTSAISAPASGEQAAKATATEKSPLALGQPRASLAPPPPANRLPTEFIADAAPQSASFAVTPAVYIPIPQPRPDYPETPARVIKVGMKPSLNSKAAGHAFADGTYVGPVTDAYYGLVQIQASIQGGRLTSLKVLRYPNDRSTSVRINRQALPMLRDEAIAAQNANVDIISGATLTSRAFRQSLAGALKQASS
ncbi:FMN-binding protein [Mesorhizobium loti]|uniref:FMN-binding protein n=1 Tax=Rhizobium loti TaxID=381 RepID=UPI00053BBAF2|nr:FMN-binding protein [Mesorhizobium loti]